MIYSIDMELRVKGDYAGLDSYHDPHNIPLGTIVRTVDTWRSTRGKVKYLVKYKDESGNSAYATVLEEELEVLC